MSAIESGDQLAAARAYVAVGVSVFPVRTDGSKAPCFQGWREYAERRATDRELQRWFPRPGATGIGITGGAASGNLAVFDFETWSAFTRWGSFSRTATADTWHAGRPAVLLDPGEEPLDHVPLPI